MDGQIQIRNTIPVSLKEIKLSYIFHLALLSLILIFNFIVYDNMLWILSFFGFLYIIILFAYLILFLLPVLTATILFLRNMVNMSLKRIKKLMLASSTASFIFGIILCYLLWTVILKFQDFYENCPYSFSSGEIQKFFDFNDPNSTENVKKCGYKKCFYKDKTESDILSYNYFCNFDSSKDFGEKNDGNKKYEVITNNGNKTISNYLIKCELINITTINIRSDVIKKYINLCSFFSDFYICKRLNKAKIFDIEYDYKCPKTNIYLTSYLLGVLCLFINLFFPIILIFTDITTNKKLLQYVRSVEIRLNEESQKTANSSKKPESNNSENSNNFKKESTDLIIVENKNNDNNKSSIININKKSHDNYIKCNENYDAGNEEQENNLKDFKDEIMENNIICLRLRNNKKEKDYNGDIKKDIYFARNPKKMIEQNNSKEFLNIDTTSKGKNLENINRK